MIILCSKVGWKIIIFTVMRERVHNRVLTIRNGDSYRRACVLRWKRSRKKIKSQGKIQNKTRSFSINGNIVNYVCPMIYVRVLDNNNNNNKRVYPVYRCNRNYRIVRIMSRGRPWWAIFVSPQV